MPLRLLHGDCLVRMTDFHAVFDALLFDPPYELAFMGSQWDKEKVAFGTEFWTLAHTVLQPGGVVRVFGATRTVHRLGAAMEAAGFVDIGIQAWAYSSGFPKSHDASKAIDALKGAKREIVGWKRGVRGADGTGHEKAMPGKAVGVKQTAIDIPITAPATPEAALFHEWGTALKPAWEPVVVARKPELDWLESLEALRDQARAGSAPRRVGK